MDQNGNMMQEALAALVVLIGGGTGFFRVNNKAQRALDKAEQTEQAIKRIDRNVETLTKHLLDK